MIFHSYVSLPEGMEVSIVMGIAQNDPFTMTMTMEPSMTMGIAHDSPI